MHYQIITTMASYVAYLLLVIFACGYSTFGENRTKIQVCCPTRDLVYTEEWGYFDVRPNANLFYWLYSEVQEKEDKSRPWFMWLQGGPGASGTGFGNFEEIGPLDADLKPRSTTWLSRGDLLFVDNPVGTGYSYVTDDNAYTKTADEIASDLTSFTRYFLEKHPEYKDRPFYIVCESYGGKMAAVYAWHLHEAIRSGQISMNFKGVGLGDSWISPIDFVDTWPDYLYYFSRLSDDGLVKAKEQAARCDRMVENGQWSEATQCWDVMESVIGQLSNDVSWYNVLKQSDQDPWSMFMAEPQSRTPISNTMLIGNDQLDRLMNGPMKEKLGVPKNVTWGGQSGMVFAMQSGDFMKPVIDTVDALLNSTNLTVFIYNGQLDLICDTPGVELWMNKMKWPHMKSFASSQRTAVLDKFGNKDLVAFMRNFKNLYFFWILKAGHMVPADAPTASLTMLDMIIGQ